MAEVTEISILNGHNCNEESDYILITNLMHWLLFIHKILYSSTCFEPQVLIFRRIQLYTCSIWYCHSSWWPVGTQLCTDRPPRTVTVNSWWTVRKTSSCNEEVQWRQTPAQLRHNQQWSPEHKYLVMLRLLIEETGTLNRYTKHIVRIIRDKP